MSFSNFREFLAEDNTHDDDHIIMQLRSAQDLDGDKEINFRRGSAKIDKKYIDKILAFHDKIQKPQDKRKLRIAISKSADDLIELAKEL